MNLVLVSAHPHPVALGLRYVSSYLKTAGHSVKVLFLSSRKATTKADFSPAVMDAFVEHCRWADLVGISLMTGNFHRACALTEALRRSGIRAPIVWGGTHPTIAPQECLEVADVVCIGEGEKPMRDLVEHIAAGTDPTGIGSLRFRAEGPFGNRQVIHNDVQPLIADLDSVPFPDYELSTHWVIEKNQLIQASVGNLRGTLDRLRILTTRGCPYGCTFCNNTAQMRIHQGAGSWVRTRSVENVLGEILAMRERFPSIEEVNIVDDLFLIRGKPEIDDFVEKYRCRVNLPLELDAHPNTVDEPKVASLASLPIRLLSMGIQSGSPATLKDVYNRHTPVERIVEAMQLFRKYRIPAEYHYIINNPFEPDANVIETLRFAARHHHKAAVLRVFPLTFYPGSPLYDRALREGLIGPRDEQAYGLMYSGKLQFARHDYLSVWLRVVLGLRNAGFPPWMAMALVAFVTSRPVRWCLDRRYFTPLAFLTYQIGRKIYKGLIYQPFVRPIRSLLGRRRKPRHPQDEVSLPRNNMAGSTT
jgi:anaerobic magnesium-protoporphyrin IX monomethyl ester cyclase